MGKLEKSLLANYAFNGCDRQLLLTIAEDIKTFYNPPTTINNTHHGLRNPELMFDLGKRYEQNIYKYLKAFPYCEYTSARSNPKKVKKTVMTPTYLRRLYTKIMAQPVHESILLEHSYTIPLKFLGDILSIPTPNKNFKIKLSDQRPDILVIREDNPRSKKRSNTNGAQTIYEIHGDGTIGDAFNKELKNISEDSSIKKSSPANPKPATVKPKLPVRLGIQVIDIKNVPEDHVGKKQFIEIIFYMRTLALFLEEHNLTSMFYVRFDFNGILPRFTMKEIRNFIHPPTIPDLLRIIIPMSYEDFQRVLDLPFTKLRRFWHNKPHNINDLRVAPPKLQPMCAYCTYFNDCKERMKFNGINPPSQYSLELFTNITKSTVEQLYDMGCNTIQDVQQKIQTITPGLVPTPLYPEIPLLKLKSEAIINNKEVYSPPSEAHAITLPKFSTIALSTCLETDTFHGRAFVFGLNLTMSVFPRSKIAANFDQWWTIWDRYLNQARQPGFTLSPAFIDNLFNDIQAHTFDVVGRGQVKTWFNQFMKIPELKIKLPGTLSNKGTPLQHALVYFQRAIFNKSLQPEDEQEFLKKIIKFLYPVLHICIATESYVKAPSFRDDFYYTPNMAIFYWGEEQMENFQKLFERHLKTLVDDARYSPLIYELISWFAPAESEVSNPNIHNKIYDLKKFAQTMIGIPTVISNTWHKTAEIVLNLPKPFSRRYWMEHFDYLDYQNWHYYLDYFRKESQPGFKDKMKEKRKKIRTQAMVKVVTLNNLRNHFQKHANNIISIQATPKKTKDFKREINIGTSFNPIAKVWYLFSLLNGTSDKFEADFVRSMYPEYSIGKLNAARVQNLSQLALGKKFRYSFEIVGLSSNMKVGEKDRVLLLPNEARDIPIKRQTKHGWIIQIRTMVWDKSIDGYKVDTMETREDIFANYQAFLIKNSLQIRGHQQTTWYLYPDSFDAWSSKLFNNKQKGLLQNYGFGNGWLGERLAYLWDITSDPRLYWPISWEFYPTEIYLYAPKLLHISTPPPTNLATPINPHPDQSQEKAILNSMNQIISCIRGPPGTGKSQTIAALIDDYLVRRSKRSSRILVMAFSYAAIRVLIDKIRKSKDGRGNPTIAASTQMVFIRSEFQDPIESQRGLKDIDDLMKRNSTYIWNGKKKQVTVKKKLEEKLEPQCIIFANAHSLYNLLKDERVNLDFYFDLMVVDEASQVPTDQIMAAYQYILGNIFHLRPTTPSSYPSNTEVTSKSDVEHLQFSPPTNPPSRNILDYTKVVIVGDDNQLPPVQPVKPPKNLEPILSSLFSYYVNHNISNSQLEINYRSHKDIVEYTKVFGFYRNLQPYTGIATDTLASIGMIANVSEPWVQNLLDPQKVVCSIVQNREHELAVSPFESIMVKKIVYGFYEFIAPSNADEEKMFWQDQLGVVSPHNAHGRLIIQDIYNMFTDPAISPTSARITLLTNKDLMDLLKNTIYSVEKFQGSDRELIIASVGLSDRDQLAAEEEFIYDINRFNVLTSRAKKKIVVISSRNYLDYIPNDREVMEYASKVRKYVFDFCQTSQQISVQNEHGNMEDIEFRYHK